MNSLTDLREVVDVVIGVDTHVHTHSASVVDARTGGAIDEITVEATADGYAQLVEFADQHAVLRTWAIEGTGGHGAGLARHLAHREESVVELDRCPGSATTNPPATTSNAEPQTARPREKSNAASSATSPETSTDYSKQAH